MNFNKQLISIILISIFILTISSYTIAYTDEGIILDNRELVNNTLLKSYDLVSVDLRLPEIELEILNSESQNKLFGLVSLYGSRDDIQINNNISLLDRTSISEVDERNLNLKENEDRALIMNPLPDISTDADTNIEDNDKVTAGEESRNLSLKYWLNNRTVLRAEYGLEDKEWWDVENIELRNTSEEEILGDPSYEHIFLEEKNEESKLGISFQTNDYVTITADYVDSRSVEKDYSTVFGVKYKDDIGTVKYHYQVDFGDQSAKESGFEFGYKDLATFNASYKIFDPKQMEDQLDKSIESIWDIGLDVNLNDISTISLGYQLQKKLSDQLIDDEDDEESNIKAELKIEF